MICFFILTACASPASPTPPITDSVIASAVVLPAQISELSFVISALVKEIPVKEGDQVQAGQTLMILHTPDLEFAVMTAEGEIK